MLLQKKNGQTVAIDSATLRPGDVVQIDPEHDDSFGGCFMTVTEPKDWGAQGYVSIPEGGTAYYRCPADKMVFIGHAEWQLE